MSQPALVSLRTFPLPSTLPIPPPHHQSYDALILHLRRGSRARVDRANCEYGYLGIRNLRQPPTLSRSTMPRPTTPRPAMPRPAMSHSAMARGPKLTADPLACLPLRIFIPLSQKPPQKLWLSALPPSPKFTKMKSSSLNPISQADQLLVPVAWRQAHVRNITLLPTKTIHSVLQGIVLPRTALPDSPE